MALLRNLEQSLSGLVEGTIGRVFRTEVRPTEIARKLAREMEINKRVSLSKTYAPTDYLVYLSPDDRGRYTGVEQSIAEELGAYLLEHARRERLVLVRRPLVEFHTDERLRLGEFGIEARTTPISAAEAPPRREPGAGGDRRAGDQVQGPRERGPRGGAGPVPAAALPGVGPTPPADAYDPFAEQPYAADDQDDDGGDEQLADDGDWLDPVDDWEPDVGPDASALAASAPWIDPTLQRGEPRAAPTPHPDPTRPVRAGLTLLIDGTPHELAGERVVLGRSRSSDIVVSDPSISRQHLELRADSDGWVATDLGTTNGTLINGQPLRGSVRLTRGVQLRLGHSSAVVEVR